MANFKQFDNIYIDIEQVDSVRVEKIWMGGEEYLYKVVFDKKNRECVAPIEFFESAEEALFQVEKILTQQ